MIIHTRIPKVTDGEVVPWDESEANVREEALKRGAKVGYCTRYGEPTKSKRIMDAVNWGKTKLNVWPRDAQGNLIE